MAQTQRTPTVPALTGIRFFAAAYVFLFHYGASALDKAGLPRAVATFLHNGYFGVSAFFVLSGFILSHAHPAQFVKARQYANYLISRFGRIYPVYLLALLVSLPLAMASLKPQTALSVVFMVQSWGNALSDNGYAWVLQAWTLSVELAFYLLFPFLVTGFRRINSPVLIALLVLDIVLLIGGGTPKIGPAMGLQGTDEFPKWLLYVPLPLVRTAEFVLGVLLNIMAQRVRKTHMTHSSGWLILVTAAIIGVLSITRSAHAIGLATLLVGILIALLYVSDNLITRLLGCRTLFVLGSASYALYLLEYPCHGYLVALLPDPYGRLLAFPITVAVSVLVWRFVEEPCRRVITRLRRREERPACVPAIEVCAGTRAAR